MYGIRTRDRQPSPIVSLVTVMLLIGFAATDNQATEIYKCTDEEGGIVYTQTPCEEPETDNDAEQSESRAEVDDPNPIPEELFVQVEIESSRLAGEDLATCQKRFRDAIDLIDAEIRENYTPDLADEYKTRLLELTDGLRRC